VLVVDLCPTPFGISFLLQDINIRIVESNDHPQLAADAEKVNYRVPGFFAKFWELNKVMWVTNADLTESHTWDSRPNSWPWLRRGINFWYINPRFAVDCIGARITDRSILLETRRFGGLLPWL
jgi:C-terminal four TMM region of protein-O-mannosyltransferase